jgi:hypothetical protein
LRTFGARPLQRCCNSGLCWLEPCSDHQWLADGCLYPLPSRMCGIGPSWAGCGLRTGGRYSQVGQVTPAFVCKLHTHSESWQCGSRPLALCLRDHILVFVRSRSVIISQDTLGDVAAIVNTNRIDCELIHDLTQRDVITKKSFTVARSGAFTPSRDDNTWRRPRREWRDLARTCLFALLRESI